jgi:hypothetical protein
MAATTRGSVGTLSTSFADGNDVDRLGFLHEELVESIILQVLDTAAII